jgi:hypothetical protein
LQLFGFRLPPAGNGPVRTIERLGYPAPTDVFGEYLLIFNRGNAIPDSFQGLNGCQVVAKFGLGTTAAKLIVSGDPVIGVG